MRQVVRGDNLAANIGIVKDGGRVSIRTERPRSSLTVKKWLATLEALANLRADGVALRNEGMALENEEQVSLWVNKMEEWRTRTSETIAVFGAHEAVAFRTLDTFDPRKTPTGQYVSENHVRYVAMYSEWIRRVEAIRRYYRDHRP